MLGRAWALASTVSLDSATDASAIPCLALHTQKRNHHTRRTALQLTATCTTALLTAPRATVCLTCLHRPLAELRLSSPGYRHAQICHLLQQACLLPGPGDGRWVPLPVGKGLVGAAAGYRWQRGHPEECAASCRKTAWHLGRRQLGHSQPAPKHCAERRQPPLRRRAACIMDAAY